MGSEPKVIAEVWELPDGTYLTGVHPAHECQGRHCVLHDPSDHHLSRMPLQWRNDRAIFERICPHGVGHPDPDQFSYWVLTMGRDGAESAQAHGCDGCCT